MRVSVVVTTYERPDALALVLRSLAAQDHRDTEVIVADDGSGPDTRAVVDAARRGFPFRLEHAWQEDRGFRAARARNLAAAASEGAYLVFLDGDCVVLRDFVSRHLRLAEKGWFVASHRMLADRTLTERMLVERPDVNQWTLADWRRLRRQGLVNRLSPLLRLPDGPWRKLTPRRWQGVRSCNMGLWRADFQAVNGFDERFVGWGLEDSDLAVRLIRAGVRRKEGRFAAPCLHLWHPESQRDRLADNDALLTRVMEEGRTRAERGLAELAGSDS